jgi:hypothetical protein
MMMGDGERTLISVDTDSERLSLIVTCDLLVKFSQNFSVVIFKNGDHFGSGGS